MHLASCIVGAGTFEYGAMESVPAGGLSVKLWKKHELGSEHARTIAAGECETLGIE